MARRWSFGAELNSVTAGVEFVPTGSPTIVTTPIRSGTYSLRMNNTGAAENLIFYVYGTPTQGVTYWRTYFRIAAYPSSLIYCFQLWGAGSARVGIAVNASGTLELWNVEDNVQIGSDSSALSLDTWYRLEISLDTTTLASSVVAGRIDGTQFASGTINLASAVEAIFLGLTAADANADFYYDDVAVNDSSGSFQNSFPGEGEVIHLRPNAVGDNNAWGRGGTDSGANWSQTEENPPNDVTDYITSNTLNQIDDYNLEATPAAMATDDIINCVQVGVRFAISSTTGGDPDFVLRIKSAASGTVEESANISGTGSVTWMTNAIAAPKIYKLTLYDLPGASTTLWTKADLDTTQIGVRESVSDTHVAWVSALWLLVDHKPAAGPTINLSAAAVAISGQVIDVQPGAVSKALSVGALTAQGQAITIQAPFPPTVINLQAAQITAQGQALDQQSGPKTTSLQAASINAQGQVIDQQSGPKTTGLQAAALTAQGLAITISAPAPGVNVNLSIAALAVQGQAIDQLSGEKTTNLQAATLNAQGQIITISAPAGGTNVNLSAAALSVQGQPVDQQSGPKTTNLQYGALVAQGQNIIISAPPGETNINLVAALLLAQGQAIDQQSGAVSIALAVAILTASGPKINIVTLIQIIAYGIVHGPDYIGEVHGPDYIGEVHGPDYVGRLE